MILSGKRAYVSTFSGSIFLKGFCFVLGNDIMGILLVRAGDLDGIKKRHLPGINKMEEK